MHRKTALLAFVASALVASGIGPAAAQKQTLKMAYWAGPSHHMVQTQEAWAKTIFDASGGNLVDRGRQGAARQAGRPIRHRQERRARSGLACARLHRRPLRPVPGPRAAVPVPELDGVQHRAVEVVRQARARGQGVHRHHAGDGFHDRAVQHPSRQAGAHARGDPGAQDPRRRRQRAGGQGARLVGGGPAGDRRLRDAAARRGRRHGVSLGGGQQLPAQRARQVPSGRFRAACSPRPS